LFLLLPLLPLLPMMLKTFFVPDLVSSTRQVYVDVQEKHPTPFASLIGIVFPFIHGVILTGRAGAF